SGSSTAERIAVLVPGDRAAGGRHESVVLTFGRRYRRQITGGPIAEFGLNSDDIVDHHGFGLGTLKRLLNRSFVDNPTPDQLVAPVNGLAGRKFDCAARRH